jgi:hypothetical protein
MIAEFRMPSLGADMEAGTLVEWLKKPGERITHGEPIAVVDTQKGAIDVDSRKRRKLKRPPIDPARRRRHRRARNLSHPRPRAGGRRNGASIW